ncbi:MAG: glutamine-hydrolyzing GMP synthase [Polyangia bacterium]
MTHDAIAVIDFGGQYAHLIATKIRRLNVLAEIRQPDDPIEVLSRYAGIIVSGSPSLSSHGEGSTYTREIYDLGIPILGLCFGHQEIAKHYGGEVIHGGRQWGRASLHIVRDHPLFAGLDETEQVWMSHFDSVAALGPGFEELGYTEPADGGEPHRYSAIGSDELRRYGFQFHAEVDDTINGEKMLANFAIGICGCSPSWTMERYLADQIEGIRERVGDGSVFLLASGGVDSTVAARLFGLALGADRLHLLHVDNGLMRKDESERVLERFRELGQDRNLHFVDASRDFLEALAGVVDPEQKRRIIGEVFVEIFEREARRLGIEDHLLGQGTIYPDTIETGGTERADTIKTHHNRVPVIERMLEQGRVIEPLADLYKVEVRELGEKLEIPEEAVWRHPFPGPGLGVRALCDDGRSDDEELGRLRDEVAPLAERLGVSALVLPIRSVGVKADLRSYQHPLLLGGEPSWDEMIEAAGTILERVDGLNRCVWSLTPEFPREAGPRAATISRERLDLLREADHLAMQGLRRHGVYDEIWQCPTVIAPLELDGRAGELVIVRPIHSERAMTATAAELPAALRDELRERILALPGVCGLGIDLTSKPPGTIEWE